MRREMPANGPFATGDSQDDHAKISFNTGETAELFRDHAKGRMSHP
jgi:hypothetical protein